MSKTPPAFQLYAADFFMDTIGWSDVEVGIYIRLLLLEWINGPLPSDHKQLIKQLKTHHKTFNKAWLTISNKFVNNGQGLINERLEETRENQRLYFETQSESGKRGIEAKKKKGIFPFDKSSNPSSGASSKPSTNPPSENQALHLQSSSSSYNNKEVGYNPPSQEEINEASLKKIKDDLEKITEELYQTKIFREAPAFKNTMLKKNINARSILHTFIRCYLKREFKNKDDSWAYCTKIIETENGNYNEREHRKTTI